MRTPAGQILLGRVLARRLFPLTLGIGLLISIGFPAIYFVIEFAAVKRAASIHAANLATQAQGLVLEAPGLWKYQTYKIEEIYRRFLAEKDVAVVRIQDETGRTVAERGKEPPTVDAWWDRYAPMGSAGLMFNNRRIGTVEVGVSLNSLVSATLKLLVIFTTVGAGLSTLAYFYPVRVVTGMEGQIHDLLDTVQRSNAQIRSLNIDLEQRVLDRTAQLAERERELHEAKAFLEHVIVSNPAIVLQGDPTGTRQTYVSPNVQRVLGYTPEEILDDPVFWINHIHPEDRPEVVAKIQGAMGAREAGVELEYRFLHKDGRYRWLHTTRRFEYDESGNVVGNLGFALDVTERKLAEDGVRKARDEAERANRAKSEFLSRMSHELRTPLNAVLGFAQILEMNVSSPQQRKAAQHIIKGGQHLLELINEVLDIARIEVGRLALSPEPVSLSEVVQESLALIMPLASQCGVSLDGEPAQAGNGYVRADRQRLKQVLLNLLSNAVKYNHKGGKVGLACEETPQGRIRINVTDTGPGIPRSMMGRLFTPFERLNADQSGVEGTGIGLALSKRLVELMGGTIGVESEVGQGSTFWVELAPAEGPLERIDRTLEDPSVPREAHTPTSARAVLYIEDNLPNLELVQHVLADRPDVRLLAAMQGRLGLEMAHQHRPDLILLDLHLPDITGDEILRRLQEDSRSKETPVVVISADATPGQIERLLAAGARAYLTKPLDVRKFITVLDEALNEREALGHR